MDRMNPVLIEAAVKTASVSYSRLRFAPCFLVKSGAASTFVRLLSVSAALALRIRLAEPVHNLLRGLRGMGFFTEGACAR
jgi:hypothetical protein